MTTKTNIHTEFDRQVSKPRVSSALKSVQADSALLSFMQFGLGGQRHLFAKRRSCYVQEYHALSTVNTDCLFVYLRQIDSLGFVANRSQTQQTSFAEVIELGQPVADALDHLDGVVDALCMRVGFAIALCVNNIFAVFVQGGSGSFDFFYTGVQSACYPVKQKSFVLGVIGQVSHVIVQLQKTVRLYQIRIHEQGVDLIFVTVFECVAPLREQSPIALGGSAVYSAFDAVLDAYAHVLHGTRHALCHMEVVDADDRFRKPVRTNAQKLSGQVTAKEFHLGSLNMTPLPEELIDGRRLRVTEDIEQMPVVAVYDTNTHFALASVSLKLVNAQCSGKMIVFDVYRVQNRIDNVRRGTKSSRYRRDRFLLHKLKQYCLVEVCGDVRADLGYEWFVDECGLTAGTDVPANAQLQQGRAQAHRRVKDVSGGVVFHIRFDTTVGTECQLGRSFDWVGVEVVSKARFANDVAFRQGKREVQGSHNASLPYACSIFVHSISQSWSRMSSRAAQSPRHHFSQVLSSTCSSSASGFLQWVSRHTQQSSSSLSASSYVGSSKTACSIISSACRLSSLLLTTDLFPMALLLTLHGDRFVIGVAEEVAAFSEPRTTDAVTKPIPLSISMDASVMKILLNRVCFGNKRLIYEQCDGAVRRVSALQQYAETPRYQRDLCNPRKAKSFSGVVLKDARNEGKPHGIKESPKSTLGDVFIVTAG